MAQIPNLKAQLKSTNTDVEIFFIHESKNAPESVSALVTQAFEEKEFEGKHGQVLLARFAGTGQSKHILLAGTGDPKNLTAEKIRSLGGLIFAKLKSEKLFSTTIYFDLFEKILSGNKDIKGVEAGRALAEGLTLGDYEFKKYRTSGIEKAPARSHHFVTSKKGIESRLQEALTEVVYMNEAVNLVRDYSNEPSNHGTPEYYANHIQSLAKKHGIKCTIMGEAECKKEKMGLFLAVGQGSDREGKVVILEYTPKAAKKNAKKIAFIGKGITFDSGGISIKPSLKMEEMKHDMTGAATVFGAILLAAMWKSPNPILCIMGFTENMPGGDAVQPGNVITSRNGKTVEINNTDAEGRLILADLLDLAKDYKPSVMINVATLTGAVQIALGRITCGMMGNNSKLTRELFEFGEITGERLWELPLYDEYFEDMKTECADMKNVGNDGAGGTIRGGIFMKQFVDSKLPWAHLDIAATSWGGTPHNYFPKRGANGQFVRLLAEFARKK